MVNTIRMHVETVADPDELDWVVRDGLVSGFATVSRDDDDPQAHLPESLANLITSGVVTRITIEDERIRIWRREDRAWNELAPLVQSAVSQALTNGKQILMPGSRTPGNDQLSDGVRELLAGDLGAYVASHGGQIRLVSVDDGIVKVKLTGACKGCPAARITLKQGIEQQLRERFPQLRGVEAVNDG